MQSFFSRPFFVRRAASLLSWYSSGPPETPLTSSTLELASPRARVKCESRYFLLLVLFAASGFSALIYEVVWYQLLQLAIGSTSVSLGILLATFMGGLCIGSLWLPGVRALRENPLRGYALLEIGIGVCAILVQFGLPLLNRVYIAGAEHGLPGMLLRGALAAVCMLAPTILMGASLPTIVRAADPAPDDTQALAFLYGINTVGAVAGCIVAGFYLLRLYDMERATLFAAVINALVAIVSFLLAGGATVREDFGVATISRASFLTTEAAKSRWPVYLTISLSGATALGAEVVWTRLLSMLLLGTVYVFSIILAVFLLGLAIGSGAASWILRRVQARAALGWSQLLLAFGIAWTAWTIVHSLPNWSDDVLTTLDPWRIYWLDLKRSLFAIFPTALFWGASFPFACAAAENADEDSGRVAGRVYAANTLGGIIGALAVSLWLIPRIGSQQTQRLMIVLAVLSALIAFGRATLTAKKQFSAVAVAIIGGLLAWSVSPVPGDLIAYGRRMAVNRGYSQILYTAEGRNSSVAISQWNNGTIYVNVNGHVEATTEVYDMKLQRMVGHLPALLHPNPQSILGIGFGAGVSAGTFTLYPSIKKITVCEIEPKIPPASTRYFGNEDYHVALDSRTHIVYDDARHFLLTTKEKYDIIASDPLDVFLKGTAALYSKEYFDAVKQHLNPGGMFTLYVPLYETDEPTIRSELATFFQAFPYGTVWANTRDGYGYDTVFMGQLTPLSIDLDEVHERYERPDLAAMRTSLAQVEVGSDVALFSTYLGSAADFAPWTAGAALNTDANLRLSYLAGWGINSNLADDLYRKMLTYRKTPTSIFTGTIGRVQAVLVAIGQASSSGF
jgi:spermidine synthase